MDTTLFINAGEEPDPILIGAVGAFDQFGESCLGRRFVPTLWRAGLPRIESFVKSGNIMIDEYRQALWNCYHNHQDEPIFTLDIVDEPLVPSQGPEFVRASSCQYFDLQTGKAMRPDKAAVIISRSTFDKSREEEYKQARAYVLAMHELGHLVVGTDGCKDEECVLSHPEDREGALERKANLVVAGNPLYFCSEDLRRMEEFRRKLTG